MAKAAVCYKVVVLLPLIYWLLLFILFVRVLRLDLVLLFSTLRMSSFAFILVEKREMVV